VLCPCALQVFAECTDDRNKMKKQGSWSRCNTHNFRHMEYGCSAHNMNLAEKELGTNHIIKHAGHRGSQCAPSKRVACREGRSSATATKYHKMDFSPGLYQNIRLKLPKVCTVCSGPDCSSYITKVLDNAGILREVNNNTHNNSFTALCPGLPGWAGTRRNSHPPTSILNIIQSLSASSVYYNP